MPRTSVGPSEHRQTLWAARSEGPPHLGLPPGTLIHGSCLGMTLENPCSPHTARKLPLPFSARGERPVTLQSQVRLHGARVTKHQWRLPEAVPESQDEGGSSEPTAISILC